MSKNTEVLPAGVNSHGEAISRLETAIVEAVVEARSTCETNGSNSTDCAVAWDIVEELQAEKSHQKQAKQIKNSLDNYCDRNPDALECRVYDI
ncbi:CP12 domain protein [Rivularia sp. PCC 7116]|uniref:Calvin cycle protein CP12 n=1 Tax=Rivularia sp. PCC 7116 TaxID=373994 RepID=UPI00029F13BB|nr:Calvin cycle protein CP12 [Rivularia sp. PCC 7116]AFY55685.1 CP12 domain protein [Rivularia sp. PCC 7116]